MKIIDLKQDTKYLDEYITLCYNEWSRKSKNIDEYIEYKKKEILSGNNVIASLGLVDNEILIGFISLFVSDGDQRDDLKPWYATMYVKKEYRGKGYSKILNAIILEQARKLGYERVYLKSDLVNYYEKFGAKYIEKLENGENLYYIDTMSKDGLDNEVKKI